MLIKGNFPVIVLLASLLGFTCQPGLRIFDGSAGQQDVSSNQYNIEWKIYHTGKDSSTCILKVPYIKPYFKGEESAGSANLMISFKVNSSEKESDLKKRDTLSLSAWFADNMEGVIYYWFNFSRPSKQASILDLNILGDSAVIIETLKIGINSFEQFTDQNFVIIPESNVPPVMDQYVTANTRIALIYNGEVRSFYIKVVLGGFEPVPPPHIFYDRDQYIWDHDTNFVSSIKDFIKIESDGFYQFRLDSNSTNSYYVVGLEEDYPRITQPRNRIRTLIYLMTTKEYGRVVNDQNHEERFNEFWFNIGGSQERAAVLSGHYLDRIENANRMYTTIMEGWKTDRGMIYIIFGNPDVIETPGQKLVWLYNNMEGNPVRFVFKKPKKPIHRSEYYLVRQETYREPWFEAVNNWRLGRVTNLNK
ncbi:MAG: GWxTD domain-containing protein [Bacteroidetes bacterium]|nr:GWxTD domain-containing protein [Bacteroidota bacterium]